MISISGLKKILGSEAQQNARETTQTYINLFDTESTNKTE
jgi:hypothetical protein